jgi:putative transposase
MSHDVPDWVADNPVFFITVNCAVRGKNQLAFPMVARAVEESCVHRQDVGQWWVHYLLLMPDHVHGIFSFQPDLSMKRLIFDWKRYLSRNHGIQWQRDFFDHRLRRDESIDSSWQYIHDNPVRAGLVDSPEKWPYQWIW